MCDASDGSFLAGRPRLRARLAERENGKLKRMVAEQTDGQSHGFVWEKGVLTDLGSLGGRTWRRVAPDRIAELDALGMVWDSLAKADKS